MYTWKTVNATNNAGVLSSMTDTVKGIGDVRQDMMDAATGWKEDYTKSQTGKATAALAGASTPEQAQDIFSQYQQGANGFVDQTALAENFRKQTKEFRDIRESDANMAYKNSQLDVSKATLAIKKGELDFRNRAQGHLETMFNTSGDAAPSSNGTDYSSNKTFGTVMGTFNKGNYGQAQVNDTMGKAAGVDYNFGGLYSTKRSAGVIPLLTQAIQRSSELSGTERDAHRTGVLQDITTSGFQPEFNAELKKQFLEGIKTNRAEETLVTTRNQKSYMTNVAKEINNSETIPQTLEEWKNKFTEISMKGNMTKADAAKKFLPQLTGSVRELLKQYYQEERYVAPDGQTKGKIHKPGSSDDNFALEIIQNPGMKMGISQFVQALGLDKATNDAIFNSLDENLGITTLQKSRAASLAENEKARVTYDKALKKKEDRNNLLKFTEMMGSADTHKGAHEDIGTAYNLVQQDTTLQSFDFLDNTDIFFQELRYFNPGADNDSLGLDAGSSMTGDFEIGTKAKQGGDVRDYAMGHTPTGKLLLARLEANDPTDVVTGAQIKAAHWRTDEPTEVALIMKVMVKEALSRRRAKEAMLDNAIKNFK